MTKNNNSNQNNRNNGDNNSFNNNKYNIQNETELRYFFDLILKRRWAFTITALLIFSAAMTYHFLQPSIYQSNSTFIIETKDVGFGALQGANPGFDLINTVKPLGFYRALMRSRIFRNRVIGQIVSKDSSNEELIVTKSEIDNILLSNVSLTTAEYSELVRLRVSSFSPILAYKIASIATIELKIRAQEIDKEETSNIISFVDNQIELAKENLENSERDLQKFKNITDVFSINEDGGIIKKLIDLENQLAEVQTQREMAQLNLDAYEKRLQTLSNNGFSGIVEFKSLKIKKIREEINNIEIEKEKLINSGSSDLSTVSNLEMQIGKKTDELIQTIISESTPKNFTSESNQSVLSKISEQRIEEELNLYTLKNKEKFYIKLVDRYKKQNPNLLENAIELSRLQRAKTVYENLYNFLVERLEEARIKAATGTGGIRVMDPAIIPKNPIPTNTTRNLILATLLSMAVGFGFAFMREYLDNSIRTPEDVAHLLHLPVLAIIPSIQDDKKSRLKLFSFKKINSKRISSAKESGDSDNSKSGNKHLLAFIRSRSSIHESYRSLRTNLQFSSVDNPIQSLLVTSPAPSEGKTLTTANLAISYAELGKKVLIIDCDLHKPTQHSLFDIKRSPGLTEYLLQDLKLEEVVQKTNVMNLDIIPSGKIPPNPAEIIMSKKFMDFLSGMKNRYEFVLVDSPPIIAVTDAMMLASKLDGVLLVLKFGATHQRIASDALDNLNVARAKTVGSIINYATYTKGYGYYNYRYYYHSYNYYGEKKEKGKKRRTSRNFPVKAK